MDNTDGLLPDPDRQIQEHITAMITERAAARGDARALESLLLRIAAIQGRLNWLRTSTQDEWEQALLDEGMAPDRVKTLLQQVRA